MINPKKIFKIIGIIILSIILLMMLTVVVAKVFEDDLASFTVEKLESQINAPMSVGKVSLIPLFSFPRISAEINKLYIGDPQSKYNDTLFYINSLKIGLDSWDLMRGIYSIDEMEISGLDLDYELDSAGKSNIDFIIDAFVDPNTEVKKDTVSRPLDLSAEKLKLENINIRYYDSLNNIGSQVTIPEITINAKTKNNIYKGKTKGSFVLSNSIFKDTKIDEMESCTVIFDLEYKDKEASINKLSIISEGVNLGMKGTFELGDTLKLNTLIDAKNLDFEILKKYIPIQYSYLVEDENLPTTDFISINVNMDYVNESAHIEDLSIKSDGLALGVKGNFVWSDTLDVNAYIETLNMNFDILKKYIPKQYFKQYGVTDIGGKMDLSATINGEFADSTLLPMVDAEVNLDKIMIQTVDYPKIDAVNLKASISTGEKPKMSDANINITYIDIISGSNNFHVNGNISGLENTQYSLRTNMDINLPDFESVIPDSLAQNIKGNIIASVRTSGMLPKNITNDFVDYVLDNTIIAMECKGVEALVMDSLLVEKFNTTINYTPQGSGNKNINVESLDLTSSTLNVNLQNTSLLATLSGKITDPAEMSANLKSLDINNGKSKIVANGKIENFEAPKFEINTNIIISLDEMLPFIPDSLINNMSGTIAANINSTGDIDLDSLDTQLFPVLFENSSIDLAFDNINLSFADSIMNVDSISAQIGLNDDILTVDDFSAIYNGLELKIDSTIVKNIYKAVILNQPEELYVNTDIKIGDFIFDDFKHFMALNTTATNDSPSANENSVNTDVTENSRNWTYLIHGSASINSIIVDSIELESFTVNKLHINDFSTLFKLTDSSYIVDQFKLKVFDGEMNNSLKYKLRKDGTESVSTHNIVQNVNLYAMLRDMDNFGMDSVISYENISGIFSTDLHTFVPIDDSVRIDKMMVNGEITLEKGGVYNYAPATEISKFTSVKELDNIQFKTLRSNIFMFKNKLYVPRTNIVSNALDIAAFGMQDLDGDCAYHLELHLSNILFGKSKRRNKKQDSESGEVDEKSLKKRSQKIKYAISDGKSKVGYDNKDARNKMMNKIRVQKKMLDFIFFPQNIHYNTNPE